MKYDHASSIDRRRVELPKWEPRRQARNLFSGSVLTLYKRGAHIRKEKKQIECRKLGLSTMAFVDHDDTSVGVAEVLGQFSH